MKNNNELNCNGCSWRGNSGGNPCCGLYLIGGDTVFIKDGKIDDVCPFLIMMKNEILNKEKE